MPEVFETDGNGDVTLFGARPIPRKVHCTSNRATGKAGPVFELKDGRWQEVRQRRTKPTPTPDVVPEVHVKADTGDASSMARCVYTLCKARTLHNKGVSHVLG